MPLSLPTILSWPYNMSHYPPELPFPVLYQYTVHQGRASKSTPYHDPIGTNCEPILNQRPQSFFSKEDHTVHTPHPPGHHVRLRLQPQGLQAHYLRPHHTLRKNDHVHGDGRYSQVERSLYPLFGPWVLLVPGRGTLEH